MRAAEALWQRLALLPRLPLRRRQVGQHRHCGPLLKDAPPAPALALVRRWVILSRSEPGDRTWREVDAALLDDGGARHAGVEVPHHFEASPEDGLLLLGLVLPVQTLLWKAGKVPEQAGIAGGLISRDVAADGR